MKGSQLIKLLQRKGCVVLRRKSSHVRVQCGKCKTTIPVHKGEDIKTGTLASIRRDLEPCLGKDWWKH